MTISFRWTGGRDAPRMPLCSGGYGRAPSQSFCGRWCRGMSQNKVFCAPFGCTGRMGAAPQNGLFCAPRGPWCALPGWPACRVRRARPAPMRARPALWRVRPLSGGRCPTRKWCARCARLAKRPRRSSLAVSSLGLFRPRPAGAGRPRSGQLWWCWARPGLRAFGRTPPGGLKVPAPCGVRGLGWFPAPGLVPRRQEEKSVLLDDPILLK